MTGSVDFQTDDPSAGINITRDDPGLDLDTIAACLDVQYGPRVSSVTFLPLGYDLNAAVYKRDPKRTCSAENAIRRALVHLRWR